MDYNIFNLSEYEIKAATVLGTTLATVVVAPSWIRRMTDFGYSQAKKIKHSKSGLAKLVGGIKAGALGLKGMTYLANKNAKSTLDLIKDDPVDLK